MQYRAGCYPPVSLSGIGKDARISVGGSQLQQVSPSCADSFPLLPKHHADTPAHPLVNALEVLSHIRQLVVVHPANHIPFQVYLPFFVVVYRSSAGELPDPSFHLRFGFGMNSQGKPFSSFVEAIAQKLYLPGICHHCLLPIHFQVQFLPNAVDSVGTIEKTASFSRSGYLVLALPIFPASHPASIVGADELNFCVRDGNRWTPVAINTNLCRLHKAAVMSKAGAFNLWCAFRDSNPGPTD